MIVDGAVSTFVPGKSFVTFVSTVPFSDDAEWAAYL